MGNIKKITSMPLQDTAVGYYRVLQPTRVMRREGLIKDCRSLPFSGEHQGQYFDFNDKMYMQICKDTDVIWTTIPFKPDFLLRDLNLRKHWGAKLIIDIDDNLYAVPSDNPNADLARRQKNAFEAAMRIADGVTVSVPNLKRLYGPLNDNIHVMPNAMDFSIWDKVKIKKNTSSKVRIGWRGAMGHKDDLEMIEPVLKQLMKDYDIEIVTLGYQPSFKTEHHEWVGCLDYPAKLGSLGLDIGIIPLVDSSFNRAKSNLGYLDFSSINVPTVLSPTENQRGMAAMEAKNSYEWYESLKSLIEDKNKRVLLGVKANKFIRENYDVRKIVVPTYKWMDKLPFRHDI
jgi:hypothetical protein